MRWTSARAAGQVPNAKYMERIPFRGNELGFRDRHFTRAPGTVIGWPIACVRECTRTGQLFAAAFLPGIELYDVIFCRNLLIYFDCAAQDNAIRVLTRLLKRKRASVCRSLRNQSVGESSLVSEKAPWHLLFARPAPRARAETGYRTSGPAPAGARHTIAPILQISAAVGHGRKNGITHTAVGGRQADHRGNNGVARTRTLVEAARCCEEYLRSNGQSSEALYLLGYTRRRRQ